MPPPHAPPLPPPNNGFERECTITDLEVRGTIPQGLSGRLVGIGPGTQGSRGVPEAYRVGDGMVHSIHLNGGRAIVYRNRWVNTNAVAQRLGVDRSPGPSSTGPDVVSSNVIVFGGSILALGEGTLAYELSSDLDTLRRVDLAGNSRGVAAVPRRDPVTGELHLLTVADPNFHTQVQVHVVVSAGALRRTSRTLANGRRINDLAITRDHVVLAADGFVGVTPRGGEAHITWIATGLETPHLVHAHDTGGSIVAYAVTPSLERWTLHASSAAMDRVVLDRTPRRFARASNHHWDTAPRFIWTTAEGSVDKHDLAMMSCVRHTFEQGPPGDLVFVADRARSHDADGGWLVGFVHHRAGHDTDLVVVDAAAFDSPAIATIRIPRHVPHGVRTTWVPTNDELTP